MQFKLLAVQAFNQTAYHLKIFTSEEKLSPHYAGYFLSFFHQPFWMCDTVNEISTIYEKMCVPKSCKRIDICLSMWHWNQHPNGLLLLLLMFLTWIHRYLILKCKSDYYINKAVGYYYFQNWLLILQANYMQTKDKMAFPTPHK